jgi:fatty acid synthase, animal type
MFNESLAPKAEATRFLDQQSRLLCPKLEHFVIFSSVSCGRGNVGQTNYGLANSIMERIIESRHALHLPAKAIQWGAVGDVGLLAELQDKNMDMTIGGSLPQRITSCIEVLDLLLTTEDPIVSSMVVAEKKVFDTKKDNVIEVLFNILGIQDKKSISMETPLSKLGMDSLMTVEISQLLEREYGLFLTMKELHTMTLHDLELKTKGNSAPVVKHQESNGQLGLELLLRNFTSEETNLDTIVCLKKNSADTSRKVLLIPGVEGSIGEDFVSLASKLKHDTFGLQMVKFPEATTLQQLFDSIIKVSTTIFLLN